MPKVLRTFHDSSSRRLVRAGDTIEATPERHDDLAGQGLVEPRDRGTKLAEPVRNKMAEPPANKAAITLEPAPTKRGPGRPPRAR